MSDKIKKSFSRIELADYLENLAQRLRSGKFEAAGHQWSVPEAFEAEIKHKEKKGRITTKLKWSWSTLADYEPSAREEVSRWQESFETIKKRLDKDFKKLQTAVKNGSLPDQEVLTQFVNDSERMAEFAEPEWQDAMNEYLDHLDNLKRAVAKQQLEDVAHELRDLKTRWISCHHNFK